MIRYPIISSSRCSSCSGRLRTISSCRCRYVPSYRGLIWCNKRSLTESAPNRSEVCAISSYLVVNKRGAFSSQQFTSRQLPCAALPPSLMPISRPAFTRPRPSLPFYLIVTCCPCRRCPFSLPANHPEALSIPPCRHHLYAAPGARACLPPPPTPVSEATRASV